ncbi:MAG: long-chain-fatty-acid--CoA ligase [Acidobacteriota bacterium]|nr:long-chain-fatty-acid--CoA ligase [Acidobacteriota bacterium]
MFWPLTPIRCLHRAIDLYGHKEAVISGDTRLTYAQFGERSERLAGGLMNAGIRAGDRVAYLSFNTNKLLEGYFGVPQARAIVMPLNVRLTPAELIAILNHSEARMLMFEKDFAPLVRQIRLACPLIEQYVGLDGEEDAHFTYEQMLAGAYAERADIATYDETAIAELFYTSGSTGTPKGVTLSHRTLYLHAMSVAGTFNRDDNGIELHTIPLFHANGWGRPQASTMMGLKHVMVRRFEPVIVFRLIQEERATAMSLVPTMANALLNAPELTKFDHSTMREIHMGGAASSPELIDRLEKAFRCDVMAGYGLTETSPVATSARKKCTVSYRDESDRLRRLAMAGWAIPGIEIRVVDAEMRDVPRNMESVGEVVILGDHVMDGYFKEPEATAAVMSGGWFHTGDMAVWDEDSYIHIVDRKKDIIISGGENISSIEVEKAIFAHPSVLECAVVAAPDEKWGEIPVAFVVLKSGESLNPEDLGAFLAARIAKFKMPRGIEFVTGPLPKTGTGKILKRELRERFWTGKSERVQG